MTLCDEGDDDDSEWRAVTVAVHVHALSDHYRTPGVGVTVLYWAGPSCSFGCTRRPEEPLADPSTEVFHRGQLPVAQATLGGWIGGG